MAAWLCLGPAPAQEPMPIRVNARLVQLNVVVTGKGGQAASGLTREDFVILDQGKPQPIRHFSVEDGGLRPGRPQPLPKNTFTNRLDQLETVPGAVTAVLFDQLNTPFEYQAFAKNELIRSLEKMDPSQRIALFTLTSDLQVLHDFSNDTASLIAALKATPGRLSTTLPRAPQPQELGGRYRLRNFLNNAPDRITEQDTFTRIQFTLGSLQALAHYLFRIPGRKNLVWISAGFPFSMEIPEDPVTKGRSVPIQRNTRENFGSDVERTARAISDANMAVYPVDARGVVNSDPGLIPGLTRTPEQRLYAEVTDVGKTQNTMSVLANRTGGRAFFNMNDLAGALREAQDDTAVSYVLAFQPSHGVWDSSFRELRVRVNRSGLRVRHRSGYYAWPERLESSDERTDILRNAAWSPVDAHGIALTITASLRPEDRMLRIEGHVEPQAITLTEGPGGSRRGALDLLYVALSPEGKNLGGIDDRIEMDLTAETFEQLRQTGIGFKREMTAPPDAHIVRVLVRDAPSGLIGSVTIPLHQVTAAR